MHQIEYLQWRKTGEKNFREESCFFEFNLSAVGVIWRRFLEKKDQF